MAMYYYASKISAIACGTRCKQTVLEKSRGQRDRDKYGAETSSLASPTAHLASVNAYDDETDVDEVLAVSDGVNGIVTELLPISLMADGVRFRRRHSEQLDAYDIDMGFQALEVSSNSVKTAYTTGTADNANLMNDQPVQYDVPKNTHLRSYCDVNYESSVLGSGGILYINGRIVSGPLESLIEILVPKNSIDFDKEFIFSFLLSSRLFLRPHELLGKLLSSVPDRESSQSLVALLAVWADKFPYDYRDERMMNHVKHIVARCSNTNFEDVVSKILSALLNRLTDLERHEADLRACQTNVEMPENVSALDRATASQYAQILCRLEKKLAKHIGPEEFLQCSSNILLDKQKKWDQPATSGGPPGSQDPKKTCNLETYLDWSARLRLFVCNEILQCIGIHDRSKTVELWSGVAQYCLLVGNYNSATAILESLESPAIARLKITWSKLQVTCQQLDCMQRHAEGHGDLWHKQAIVLNESHQKTDSALNVALLTSPAMTTAMTAAIASTTTTTTATITTPTTATITTPTTTTTATATTLSSSASTLKSSTTEASVSPSSLHAGRALAETNTAATVLSALETSSDFNRIEQANNPNSGEIEESASNGNSLNSRLDAVGEVVRVAVGIGVDNSVNSQLNSNELQYHHKSITATATAQATSDGRRSNLTSKSNDWVVIPVFADIVKLALTVREECLQRLPNSHINICAFDRLAAIVGAFTKHMHAVKSATEGPLGEYEMFCRHMQKTSTLSESELMMASFDCEEPNNAEKLMYDLN